MLEKILGMILGAVLIVQPAMAKRNYGEELLESLPAIGSQHTPVTVPAEGTVEVAFSPSGGAEALVIKVINSATRTIRVVAYSFTSRSVTAALLRARKRGVDVALLADYKNNLVQDQSGRARAALSALSNAGVRVRIVDAFPIMHEKLVLSDDETVQSGSFNYSESATRNSEHVLVMWKNAHLAAVYRQHWERTWALGREFRPAY